MVAYYLHERLFIGGGKELVNSLSILISTYLPLPFERRFIRMYIRRKDL